MCVMSYSLKMVLNHEEDTQRLAQALAQHVRWRDLSDWRFGRR